ncbi:hypothetical protein [Streptomyces anthocyanicus]|uniref:hypothetical protein n=1 Tax=Streptomyces anthocyanicus TaxID=68174 RepID=UPI00363EBE22
MAGDVEQSEIGRGMGVFPTEWGVPAGSQFSEERKQWVAARVQEHSSLQRLRRKAASMASRSGRTSDGSAARARVELLGKRW